MLKLRLKQSHLSLSIKKHIKDAVNAVEFELPVDKEFYDSVSEGTEIIDKFRFGSMVLYGSLGDWEMTVKEKYVKWFSGLRLRLGSKYLNINSKIKDKFFVKIGA